MNQKPLIFVATTTNPHVNIALETWLLKEFKSEKPVIFLWQNFNSIIIGRNQNTYLEVNQKLVEEYQVKVARRLSGGGAVFQDKNNLCWTFIMKNNKGGDYRFFATPVLEFLKSLNVHAEFQGRNDLSIEGRKISGTAQLVDQGFTLCHGTLLFNVDLAMMTSLLTPNLEKLSSKGVDSVKKRVVNIKEYLPSLTTQSFSKMFQEFLEKYFDAKIEPIPQAGLDYAEKMAKTKFSTWEWNYGESKEFQFVKKETFPSKGTLMLCFNTNHNIIKDIKIYGDFLALKELDDLVASLINCEYEKNRVRERLQKLNLTNYLGTIELEDFINCMFN